MGQPPVLQRIRTAHHRGVADVAAVGEQQRGDRDVQVRQAGNAAGGRGERLVGAGPAEHLQQPLGQVHPGQHPVDGRPQIQRRGRFGLRLQGGEVQPAAAVEDDLRVVPAPGRDLPIGAVQQRGPRRQMLPRLSRSGSPRPARSASSGSPRPARSASPAATPHPPAASPADHPTSRSSSRRPACPAASVCSCCRTHPRAP